MVSEIANLHGAGWNLDCNYAYQHLRQLTIRGLILGRKVMNGTKEIAYTVSKEGARYLRVHHQFDSAYRSDPARYPADCQHYLRVNRIILEIARNLPLKFWLSHSQIQAENSTNKEGRFARDYDSVAEFRLPVGNVRIAIQCDISRWRPAEYATLRESLAAETRLSLAMLFCDGPPSVGWVAKHFNHSASPVCFIDRAEFDWNKLKTTAYFWSNNELKGIPTQTAMLAAAKRPCPEYIPLSQLRLLRLQH
jgi:hypothetical protein